MPTYTSEKDHVIIGTAGHIDHGKTALIKALTGIDADTLAEEKRRGITIELGFVFMKTPEDMKQVVFIDVPGHEKLIKTMVAGASSIDAALLVIAADEGVSVQTQEHLEILKLLGIKRGIIALTKADLTGKAQMENLIPEVKSFVKDTFLRDAPVVLTSAESGEGIEELRRRLLELSKQVKARQDNGMFRMPVDRVFTMPGFGTVIAGTVLSGEVKVGDRVEILPEGMLSRVRGIQVYRQKVKTSRIGRRTALNLPDIKKQDLHRGQCAALPGWLPPTIRLDAKLFLLTSSEKELKNRARLRLHVGTAEIICRIMLMGKDKLLPGESGFAQFVLESPTAAVPGDRFVIRTFSPLMTVGGGTILDSDPIKHRRFDDEALSGLERLDGDAEDMVEQMFLKSDFLSQNAEDIALKIGQSKERIEKEIEDLIMQGRLVIVTPEKKRAEDARYIHINFYDNLKGKVVSSIEDFLRNNPYQLFMPMVELHSQMMRSADSNAFGKALQELQQEKLITTEGKKIGLGGYTTSLKPKEVQLAGLIEEEYKRAGLTPPVEEDVRQRIGAPVNLFNDIMSFLLESKKLYRLSEKVTYHTDALLSVKEFVIEYIRNNRSISLAELRDELKFSRKYAQAILEHLDNIGLTRREGNRRVLVD